MTTNSDRITVTSIQDSNSEKDIPLIWQQLSKYFVSASLGVVGGGAGVAATMVCIINIQLFYVTDGLFVPNLPVVAVVASVAGIGASWVLYYVVQKFSPFELLRNLKQDSLQVVFVVSILTSLLETFLFMQNMFAGLTTQIQHIWV